MGDQASLRSLGLHPFVERQIAGDHCGTVLIGWEISSNDNSTPVLGSGIEAQLIDDQQLVGGHLLLEAKKRAPPSSRDQGCRRGEADKQVLLAGGQAESHMRLAHAAWAESNDVLASLARFAACHFQHLHLVELGDGGEVEAVEAFDDREFGRLDAAFDRTPIAFDHLPLGKPK